MRLVGESIYQKGSLSMHPIMAAPLLALSLAGLAVPAAAQPRAGASDGVERADAGDEFYCAERRLGQWFYCSKPRATAPEKQAVPVPSSAGGRLSALTPRRSEERGGGEEGDGTGTSRG